MIKQPLTTPWLTPHARSASASISGELSYCALAGGNDVSALMTWRWNRSAVPEMSEYEYLPIELDFGGAVTMTLTMAAVIKPRVEHGSMLHEGVLWWVIEDSINGDDWYPLTAGVLTPRNVRDVKRISSPLGLLCRLGVRGVVGGGRVGWQEWPICEERSCSFKHDEFTITQARFDAAVRSI